jgi:hypothetical protein
VESDYEAYRLERSLRIQGGTCESEMIYDSMKPRGLTQSNLTSLVHFVKKLNPINSTVFVLFGKYCPIVDQLGSKDSFRDFQLNCVISYF